MPYEKPVVLVIKTREKEYKGIIPTDPWARSEDVAVTNEVQVIGKGWEIVESIKVRSINLEKAKKKYGIE